MISHWLPKCLIPVLLCTATIAGPVQKAGLRLPNDASIHRDAVKEIFQESYAAYKYGGPHRIPFLESNETLAGNSRLVMMIYHQ